MKTEQVVEEAVLDDDEAWLELHADDRLMPIEGMEPRQQRIRLEVNRLAIVNADVVTFHYHGSGKVVVAYASYRRGNGTYSGPCTVNSKMRYGDRIDFLPGKIRLSTVDF